MSIYKLAKDKFVRLLLGKSSVPSGLAELNRYFRLFGPIQFRVEKQGDGSLLVLSENFRFGSIITHATREEDVEERIKDALLTAFEVPSSYAKEAGIRQVKDKRYAFA